MGKYVNIIHKIATAYCRKHPERGLTFVCDGNKKSFGSKNTHTIIFRNAEKTWKQILKGGSIALGNTYIENKWDGDYKDIPFFLEFMLNILEDKTLIKNLSFYDKLSIVLALKKSVTKSSGYSHEKNINSHYSLEFVLSDINASNKFFFPVLSKDFPVYSCGLWETGAKNLEEAQLEKFKLYAKLLNLKKSKKLIDLGCGWGIQSLWYAKNLGVNVTLVTLSKAQAKYIQDIVKKENLQNLVTLKLMDMMDVDKLNKKYDAIISLGAIEHIEDFNTLFKKSRSILSSNGIALFHTMFNHIHHDFDAWNSIYMWPGVQIPSRQRLLGSLTKYFENVSFTPYKKGSYSKTFRCWLDNFVKNEKKLLNILDEANPSGDNKKFMRKFKYYLMCCVSAHNVYMDVGYALCSSKRIER